MKKMVKSYAIISGLAISLAATGCSPYVYKTEINAFTDQVASIPNTVNNARNGIDKIAASYRIESWGNSRLEVHVSGRCYHDQTGVQLDPDCSLDGPDSDALGNSKSKQLIQAQAPYKADKELDTLKPIIMALDKYASALKAVTNAADRDSLDKAAQALKTSIGSFADALPSATINAEDKAVIKQLPAVFTALIEFYLDSRRYDVLSTYVPVADQLVKIASSDIGVALDYINQKRKEALSNVISAEEKDYNSVRSDISPFESQQRLAHLNENVVAYKAAASFNGRDIAKAISDAHNILAIAIKDNKGQDQAVIDAIKSLATSLQAAYDALTKASATKA